ncbi:protein-lysine N-methyltransferase SMYD4 [Genypterus blacodes]|uniref:protein-lysine N-methyltransferase SMYD4 n=1 Tax=Genypterus blacodes TaxID=154954 RepID=UPI003F775837
MDLPCVRWQDRVAQKWAGLDPDIKERFGSLCVVDDVFQCSLSVTTQEDLGFLQSISAGSSAQKDAEQAARCREKGNSCFKSRDYKEATLHYSQGVCSAPRNSEQLPLCYANRSAALYHLQLYQESLDDIDSAVDHGYPSQLLHKLDARRAQCLNQLKNKDGHKPAPDRAPGQTVKDVKTCVHDDGHPSSSVSPKTSVSFSPEKGRHLVATERIAAGEVILTDRPYSCVLIPGMEEVRGKERSQDAGKSVFGTEHRRCHRCLGQTWRPVPCDHCTYSRYCSADCRREAWEEHHCWECPLGADLGVMGVKAHLALRTTLKAGLRNVQMSQELIKGEDESSDEAGTSTSHYGDSYLSVYHLLHHCAHHSPSLRFLCGVTVATLYLRLSKSGPPPASWDPCGSSGPNSEGGDVGWGLELRPLGGAVLRHMLQLRCNAQAVVMLQDTGASDSLVQSNREMRVATAIFPTLSLLNHSCSPNTSLVFHAGTAADPRDPDLSPDFSEDVTETCGVAVTVRAAKAITAGQEILHCYGPHSSRMVTQERRRLLQEQYYFLCQCAACNLQRDEEEGRKDSQPGRGASPRDSGLRCGECKGFLKQSGEGGGRGFICSQLSCSHHLSPSEVSRRLRELSAALDSAVDLLERERPGEALTLLKTALSRPGPILAETHPLQGELADALARAYATMGDWSSAASQLERSIVAIGSQYGEESIELGRQLFKLAQLHFNGGAVGPALSVIPKVRRLLGLHCGPRSHELQELQAMEDCLRG